MPLIQELWKKHFSTEGKLQKEKDRLSAKKRELELTKEINKLNQEISVIDKEIVKDNEINLVKHNVDKNKIENKK